MNNYDTLCEMSAYRSLSHYLSRRMTRQQVATLTPEERKARRLAQERVRRAKPTKTFTYTSNASQRKNDGRYAFRALVPRLEPASN
jgi:hypothetical protein